MGALDTRQNRNGAKEDRDGAAQTDPGDKSRLARREAIGQEAQDHRDRTGNDDQDQRDAKRRQKHWQKRRGRDQQTHHQEHADLGEPGHAVGEAGDLAGRPVRIVAEREADQIDRQKAAGPQTLRQRKDQKRQRTGQNRIKAGREFQPVDRAQHKSAAEKAEKDAAHHLPEKVPEEVDRRFPAGNGLTVDNDRDQRQGQKNCHRVVDARLDLKRGSHTRLQAQPPQMQQEKHRGRVGRADDRAEQHRLGPAEPEQELRRKSRDCRGEHDADGRQQHGGPEGPGQSLPARSQAAIEQDQGQRKGTDQIGNRKVVKNDATRPVFAGQHAKGQKDQQQGGPNPRGQDTREDREGDQRCGNQNDLVGKIHRRLNLAPAPCCCRARDISLKVPLRQTIARKNGKTGSCSAIV